MKNYSVAIYGETYDLVSDEEENYVLEVVDMVNMMMEEISQQSSIKDPKKIAVLASLQLAGKIVSFKKEAIKSTDKIHNLIDTIKRDAPSL